MTKLPYDFWCHHLTEVGEGVTWRQVDFDARVIVRGLKQETFNGYLSAKIGGKARQFDKSNVEELIKLIVPAVGRALRDDVKGLISIVPVPNSGMALGVGGLFRTVELAEMVAGGYGKGAAVVPAIRWDKPREKSHKVKGFRHPGLYEPHMRLAERLQSPVVLFDDVLTSGSQMVAAARMLTKKGFAPVRALVVARATKLQVKEDLWSKRTDELDLSDDPFDFDDL